MNILDLAAPLINAINPYVPAEIHVCTGYSIIDFEQVPIYADPTLINAQIQPISQTDMMHIEGLNLQGIQAAVWCQGHFSALNRPAEKGNDLFILDGKTWIIAKVVEWWPNWCHFVVTEQLDG